MKAEDDRLGCSCGWRRDVCNKSGVIFVFFTSDTHKYLSMVFSFCVVGANIWKLSENPSLEKVVFQLVSALRNK